MEDWVVALAALKRVVEPARSDWLCQAKVGWISP
jgi:hypothetical protein